MLSVAVGVIASHAILPLGEVSWRSKALLSVSAAIIAVWVLYSFGPLRRPFALYHADLSKRWLEKDYFSGADLRQANLIGSHLSGANLSHADLTQAKLSGARLSDTKLEDPDREYASIFEACRNAATRLPEGVTVKPCRLGR